MLTAAVNATIRLFLAPECAACEAALHEPLAGPVCETCWNSVLRLTPPWCARCGDACAVTPEPSPLCARCRDRPPVFDAARSAALYDGAFREIVQAFKYDGRRAIAPPLARLMIAAGGDLLRDADAVVPVPLHPWRTIRRGFNQADDLARELRLPVWRALRRRRLGPSQVHLSAGSRKTNVGAAYALRRMTSRRRLRGSVVVLVDDVMTTGATLEACGRVLLDAGVRSVRALTAGRAVAGRPARPLPRPLASAARRR
jgi:ComF family protein